MTCQHTSYLTMTLVALAITACSATPNAGLIPGANMDPVGGAQGGKLARQYEQPCGYDVVTHDTQPGYEFHSKERARITYDQAGMDVLEEGFTEDNEFSFRYTSEYNAMGNPLHFLIEFAGVEPQHLRLVYDSFGRLIQYSSEYEGQSDLDWVATYTYGDDGLRRTAHAVFPEVTSDRTYHYDENARLIQLDRDDGPDGVIDQTTRLDYDDMARLTTKTVTNREGAVIRTGTITYDNRNRIISSSDTETTPNSSSVTTHERTWTPSRLVSETLSSTITLSTGETIESGSRYDWRYGSCQ